MKFCSAPYAIGIAKPVGIYINTYGTSRVTLSDGEIALKISGLFDLRPYAIVKRFGLKNPIFLKQLSMAILAANHSPVK